MIGVAALATGVVAANAQPARRTLVLVHGAWGGGWVWRRVADLLEKSGHKVFTPTMSGLGERSHLLNAQLNLTTHITDIVNVIKWERLEGIVLVGHSYGGMVISGVAERVENAIASIVCVDAFVPENGQALIDIATAGVLSLVRTATEKGELAFPPLTAEFFRVNESDRAWVDGMCTPHPNATFTETPTLTGARERIARKTYVRASGYSSGPFDAALAKCRAAGWRTHEMPCGHYVMVDMPEALAEILAQS
jgi:pimeloyl-ACP methyl ester carboxylesterase